MRIPPVVFGVLVLALFFGTIFTFQAAGFWSISGKVTSSGEKVAPTGADVSEIKGWMTLEQVVAAYQVPADEIFTHFNLPAKTSLTVQLKSLESETFSVEDLRVYLQERQNNP